MKKAALVLLVVMFTLYPVGCADENGTRHTMEISLYFGNPQAIEIDQPGEYGYVLPVSREIPQTDEMLRAALEELIKGPGANDGDLLPAMSNSVNILDITVENATATINFCREVLGNGWEGGVRASEIFIQAISWTVTQFEHVDDVLVLVEGEPWEDGHFLWDEPLAPVQRPEEIREWISYSRSIFMAQAREFEDKLFLLVTYGPRPTGGYSVRITDVVQEENSIVVSVVFSEPGDDEEVTPATTYPYDVKQIEASGLPVVFDVSGDLSYVPQLYGRDWLPPLVAGSDDIWLLSPAPGDSVSREFTVEGIELVFEGTVNYRLLNSQRAELDSGIAVGGHGTDWGLFNITLTVPAEVADGDEIILVLYAQSPKDGSEESVVEVSFVLEE